jgi:hypothetical protein
MLADPALFATATGRPGEAGGAKVRRAAPVAGASSTAGPPAARAKPVDCCRRTTEPTGAAASPAGAVELAGVAPAPPAVTDRAKTGGDGLPARTEGRNSCERRMLDGNTLVPLAEARLWPTADGIKALAARPMICGLVDWPATTDVAVNAWP